MNQALKTLDLILQGSAAGVQAFPPNSRYHGIPLATRTAQDGRVVPYLTRRFVPQPSAFNVLTEHVVVQGDRPDNIAAQHFGDPEQWWRLADANGVIAPAMLTATLGVRLHITLPVGIPTAMGGR